MPLFIQPNIYVQKIQALIADAFANPLVDDESMAALFIAFVPETTTYEQTGVDVITPALQNDIDTDGPNKAFLLSYVDAEETITVFMAIQAGLA
jgi:hypothetical protein